MGCATIDFTDIGDLARTSFVEVSGLGDQPTHLEPEISSEYCFEGIVGKSAALQKVLEQVAIVAPTDSTVLLQDSPPRHRKSTLPELARLNSGV